MGRCVLLFLISTAALAQTPAPLGQLVDVGGYRVHLYCTGTGSPTVMVVGAGFSFDWGLVQPEVAKSTRICTYDVSGTAWSDPGPELTCRARVNEVHQLLRAAHIEGPYILVGFSLGGLVARLYASEYPKEVAGMVIVDHAFSPKPLPKPPGSDLDTAPVLIYQAPILLTVEDSSNFSKLPERIQELHRWAVSLNPKYATGETADECESQVKAGATLGDLPLAIVSTGNQAPGYKELQTELLGLSRNSSQAVAEKSFHSVEIDQPEVVIGAILNVVDSVRKK